MPLTFPESFVRTTLRWQLVGGEVANTALSWRADDTIVALDDETVDALAGQCDAFWTAIKSVFPQQASYLGSRVAWIGTDGHTLSAQERPVAPVVGGSTDPSLPTEVALVVSLRTAVATRSTRGRMYLPPLTVSQMGYAGRYLDAAVTTVADGAEDFMNDVTVGTTTWTPVVASGTASLLTPITQIAVGNVPDAQRRRRDSLIEAYTTRDV